MQQERQQEKKLRGEEVDISKALCSCFIFVAVIKHSKDKGSKALSSSQFQVIVHHFRGATEAGTCDIWSHHIHRGGGSRHNPYMLSACLDLLTREWQPQEGAESSHLT